MATGQIITGYHCSVLLLMHLSNHSHFIIDQNCPCGAKLRISNLLTCFLHSVKVHVHVHVHTEKHHATISLAIVTNSQCSPYYCITTFVWLSLSCLWCFP